MIKDWEKSVNDLTQALYKGEKIYRDLEDIRPDRTDMIVCPEHLGDTIWIVSYAKAYIKDHDCDYLYFVVKDSQNEMTMNFPDVQGTVALTDEEMSFLNIYIIVMGYWNKNHIIYGHYKNLLEYDSENQNFFTRQIGHGKSIAEERKLFLGIEESDILPSKMKKLDDGEDADLKALFNKAVLLIPAAQSEARVNDVFWRVLAEVYKKMGYDVFTNYNGFSYEQKIEGTKHISSTILELAQMGPYFAQVIALRSGACDLLALTDSNLSVIYNQGLTDAGVLLKKNDISWDSLYDLAGTGKLCTYQYLRDRDEELITALVRQLEN